jgi:hypothetical protein
VRDRRGLNRGNYWACYMLPPMVSKNGTAAVAENGQTSGQTSPLRVGGGSSCVWLEYLGNGLHVVCVGGPGISR